jgi:hypothetical protein
MVPIMMIIAVSSICTFLFVTQHGSAIPPAGQLTTIVSNGGNHVDVGRVGSGLLWRPMVMAATAEIRFVGVAVPHSA